MRRVVYNSTVIYQRDTKLDKPHWCHFKFKTQFYLQVLSANVELSFNAPLETGPFYCLLLCVCLFFIFCNGDAHTGLQGRERASIAFQWMGSAEGTRMKGNPQYSGTFSRKKSNQRHQMLHIISANCVIFK